MRRRCTSVSSIKRGTKLVHKNLPTTPEAFLRVIAPYREDLVVGGRMYVHVVLAGGPLCRRKGLPLSWGMPSI